MIGLLISIAFVSWKDLNSHHLPRKKWDCWSASLRIIFLHIVMKKKTTTECFLLVSFWSMRLVKSDLVFSNFIFCRSLKLGNYYWLRQSLNFSLDRYRVEYPECQCICMSNDVIFFCSYFFMSICIVYISPMVEWLHLNCISFMV